MHGLKEGLDMHAEHGTIEAVRNKKVNVFYYKHFTYNFNLI